VEANTHDLLFPSDKTEKGKFGNGARGLVGGWFGYRIIAGTQELML
jgi:hypothetical protein